MSHPLVGCRVLVPRVEDGSDAVVEQLTAAGAAPHAVPLLTIGPPTDRAALDVALHALAAGDFSWVGFASANAVAAVTTRAAALGLRPAVPAGTRIAAVGTATAAALRAVGLSVDLVPAAGAGAAVLAAGWPHPGGSERVLLPSSEIGLPDLADALRDKGYRVERVAAYAPRSLPAPAAVGTDLRAGGYDAVLLTSPSLARAVAELRPAGRVLMVAIGSTTAAGAAAAGLRVAATAEHPTPAGLLTALERARTADRPHPDIPPTDSLSRNEPS